MRDEKMENILTAAETEEVRSLIRSLDKKHILSQGGSDKAHFGHRRYKLKGNKIWAYYVPDFSQVSKDYIKTGMEKIASTVGLEDKIDIRMGYLDGRRIMYAKFFNDSVVGAVRKKITKDHAHIDYLLQKNSQQKAEAKAIVDETEWKISRGDFRINAQELFEKTTDFFSMNMDKFYPYSMLRDLVIKGLLSSASGNNNKKMSKEQKETEACLFMNSLFYPASGSNSSIETHLAFMDLAEQVHYGEQPDIKGFIMKVGCYSTNDIIPASLENEGKVRQTLGYYLREYPTIDSIIDYREEWAFTKQMMRMRKNEAVRTLVGCFSGQEKEFAAKMCMFAEAASECNEARRKTITRAYRCYRDIISHYGMDMMKTPVTAI
jgi:hypothetical protein